MAKSILQNSIGLKKFLAVFCLVALLFSCVTVTAMADEKGVLEVSSCTAARGETVEVSLNLKDNPGIWGTKLKVKYDKSVLTLKSVSAGTVFGQGELTCSETLDKEPYVIVATGSTATNKNSDGRLVTLQFAVAGDAAYRSHAVKVDITQTTNAEGKDLNLKAVDGSVTVKAEQAPPSGGGNDQPSGGGNDQPSGDADKQPSGDVTDGDEDEDADKDAAVDQDEEDDEDGNVATGDSNRLLPYICLILVAALGVTAIVKRRRG